MAGHRWKKGKGIEAFGEQNPDWAEQGETVQKGERCLYDETDRWENLQFETWAHQGKEGQGGGWG